MHKVKQVSRLLVFGEVAKQGSFTSAAKALGISKSAVSQQISLLEKELAVQLMSRTTRGLTLTAIGEKVLIRCQSIQQQVDSAFIDLVNAQYNPQGSFTITYPYSIESNIVIPAMQLLCSEFPGLQPELIASDTQIDLVTNNIDMAIRGGQLPDSMYRALPLAKITEIFCATPLYLQRSGLTPDSFSITHLTEHPWISSSWQKPNMIIHHLLNQTSQVVKLNQYAKTNTLPSALNLALNHMGIVSLPDISVLPYLRTSELVHIATHVCGPIWPLHTLHTYQTDKPLHVTRFHHLLKQVFASQLVYGHNMSFKF